RHQDRGDNAPNPLPHRSASLDAPGLPGLPHRLVRTPFWLERIAPWGDHRCLEMPNFPEIRKKSNVREVWSPEWLPTSGLALPPSPPAPLPEGEGRNPCLRSRNVDGDGIRGRIEVDAAVGRAPVVLDLEREGGVRCARFARAGSEAEVTAVYVVE